MPHEVGFGPRPYKYGGNPEQRIALQPGLDTPINIKIRENLNFGGGLGGSDYYSHSYGSNGYDSFDIKFKASVGGTGFVQNTGFSWGMFAQNALGALMNVGMFAMMAKWFGGNNAAAGTGINPLFNNFGGLTGGNYGGTFDLAHSYVTPFTPTATGGASAGGSSAGGSSVGGSSAGGSSAGGSLEGGSSVGGSSAGGSSAGGSSAGGSSAGGSGNGNATIPTASNFITLINGDAAGKVIPKAGNEGVASLKKDDSVRGTWQDVHGTNNQKTTLGANDQKDAVKLGTANGTDGDKKSTNGYPTYFTITDYRSHNMFTFEYVSGGGTETLKYKIVQGKSDITKDDTEKYNNTNWGFDSATDGTVYDVVIEDGEIVLKNGNQTIAHKI